jgi:hypothetical protein
MRINIYSSSEENPNMRDVAARSYSGQGFGMSTSNENPEGADNTQGPSDRSSSGRGRGSGLNNRGNGRRRNNNVGNQNQNNNSESMNMMGNVIRNVRETVLPLFIMDNWRLNSTFSADITKRGTQHVLNIVFGISAQTHLSCITALVSDFLLQKHCFSFARDIGIQTKGYKTNDMLKSKIYNSLMICNWVTAYQFETVNDSVLTPSFVSVTKQIPLTLGMFRQLSIAVSTRTVFDLGFAGVLLIKPKLVTADDIRKSNPQIFKSGNTDVTPTQSEIDEAIWISQKFYDACGIDCYFTPSLKYSTDYPIGSLFEVFMSTNDSGQNCYTMLRGFWEPPTLDDLSYSSMYSVRIDGTQPINKLSKINMCANRITEILSGHPISMSEDFSESDLLDTLEPQTLMDDELNTGDEVYGYGTTSTFNIGSGYMGHYGTVVENVPLNAISEHEIIHYCGKYVNNPTLSGGFRGDFGETNGGNTPNVGPNSPSDLSPNGPGVFQVPETLANYGKELVKQGLSNSASGKVVSTIVRRAMPGVSVALELAEIVLMAKNAMDKTGSLKEYDRVEQLAANFNPLNKIRIGRPSR